ncbi:hypothetical protein MYA98_26285 [Salmonella sp. WGH-01]|nr:hypothetical protein MYA98_26285 [Salmonella sp. WGH-01]
MPQAKPVYLNFEKRVNRFFNFVLDLASAAKRRLYLFAKNIANPAASHDFDDDRPP